MRYVERDGVRIPTFFYGTAWKEERTETLARTAIEAGFRAIDTANQRKHYFEAAVGAAVQGRADLFVQTKFTFRDGQDHRLPYDPRAPVAAQVAQSFASSLEHLGRGTLDAYVLHGPSVGRGLAEADWEAWRAMERLHTTGAARFLGVSNVRAEQLEKLLAGADVRPAFVQNRCYARDGWDREVRRVCAANGVLYQGFSLLTANPEVLRDARVRALAAERRVAVTRLVFRFCLDAGMIVLTGTSDRAHMTDDLAACEDAPLTSEQVHFIESGFVR